MQFLFAMRVKENAAPVTTDQLETEVGYVRTIYASDTLRQIWSRTDVAGACLLIEAENESTARAAIEALPLMKADKLEIQTFIPLRPYRGFAQGSR
ncbi:hypothetical protein MXF29_24115 [Pseudomonas sp. NC26]|uniref:hypothetical protein n=1 Tax=unclassified Pseudomonas TaxID=196821 RepID=UPI0006D475BE|nr:MULTISPECIES: hypothetical protein [unclassified Pseudomonas]MEC4878687.1 hypothetical protein [Pseudomonas sp. NC26]